MDSNFRWLFSHSQWSENVHTTFDRSKSMGTFYHPAPRSLKFCSEGMQEVLFKKSVSQMIPYQQVPNFATKITHP